MPIPPPMKLISTAKAPKAMSSTAVAWRWFMVSI
jgi:hypothetical protein